MSAITCFPGTWAPYELSITTSIISVILAVTACSGNLLVIISVIKDPKLQTPFNYFLTNLAVSDFLFGAIALTISTYVHYEESRREVSIPLMQAVHMSYFIAATASLLSLIALSVDRFIAIVHAARYKCIVTPKRSHFASFLIWLVSFTVPFVYFKLGMINYLMFFANTVLVVGLLLLIVIYARVYNFLQRQSKEMQQHLNLSRAVDLDKLALKKVLLEKKIAGVFITILLVYILTYLPAIVMVYTLHYCTQCNCILRHVFRDGQFWLISLHCAVNPFICTIRLKHFKRAIVRLFGCPSRNKVATNEFLNTQTNIDMQAL